MSVTTLNENNVFSEFQKSFCETIRASIDSSTSLQDQYEIVKEYIESEPNASCTPMNFTDFQAGVYQKIKGYTDDDRNIEEFLRGVNYVNSKETKRLWKIMYIIKEQKFLTPSIKNCYTKALELTVQEALDGLDNVKSKIPHFESSYNVSIRSVRLLYKKDEEWVIYNE